MAKEIKMALDYNKAIQRIAKNMLDHVFKEVSPIATEIAAMYHPYQINRRDIVYKIMNTIKEELENRGY